MRAHVSVALVAALATSACLRPAAFTCATDGDCARGSEHGTCEAAGYCSFGDATCASGRRFGALSGGYADQCVAGDQPDAAHTAVDARAADGPVAIDAPPADAPTGCPVGYALLPGLASTHRYKALPTAAWTNQRSICGAEPANVYLAVPDNLEELTALAAFAGADFWIGISDAAAEGSYVTVLGATATFAPWAPNEPDNTGNQDCVRALAASSTIETDPCGSQAIAVCECVPP